MKEKFQTNDDPFAYVRLVKRVCTGAFARNTIQIQMIRYTV